MQELSEKKESYEQLKEGFLLKVEEYDVNEIKKHFKLQIDSDRTFFMINSVKELLSILEERDYINEDNLKILDDLVKHYQEENVLSENDVSELQEAIRFHLKEFDCFDIDLCSICSNKIFSLPVPLQPTAPPLSPSYMINSLQPMLPMKSDVSAAILFISRHIGQDWRPFVSFLGVQERKIQEIYNKYDKKNSFAAAYEALTEWNEQSHKTEEEKKKLLIKYLQRKNVYFHSTLAEKISFGEHLC